jgi:hypothetical protein
MRDESNDPSDFRCALPQFATDIGRPDVDGKIAMSEISDCSHWKKKDSMSSNRFSVATPDGYVLCAPVSELDALAKRVAELEKDALCWRGFRDHMDDSDRLHMLAEGMDNWQRDIDAALATETDSKP